MRDHFKITNDQNAGEKFAIKILFLESIIKNHQLLVTKWLLNK